MPGCTPPKPLNIALLLRIAGQFGKDSEGERAMAAERATLMLREAGLTWEQVIEGGLRSLGLTPSATVALTDDFEDMTPPEPVDPPTRRHVTQSEIPTRLVGTLRFDVKSERTTRTGDPMALLSVHADNVTYGPIAAFGAVNVSKSKEFDGRRVICQIIQPRQPRNFPYLMAITPA